MRYVVHPKSIQLRNRRTGELGDNVAFIDFAEKAWFADERPAATPVLAARWARVLDAFYASAPGDVIALEDQDFETLRGVVEAPHIAFPSLVAVQLAPFSSAVLCASTEDPRGRATADEAAPS